MAMLTTLENFLKLRSNINGELNCLLPWRDAMIFFTLQQMHRILTTRQAAQALLVISDYFSWLRALSLLWLARPRDARHGVAERVSHRPRPRRHGQVRAAATASRCRRPPPHPPAGLPKRRKVRERERGGRERRGKR
uniref:DOG1 domain-containing protein n=1 Tax=Oryza barthii TaxID=65489 RepID=A0A0D3EX24_9ORYZ